MLKDDDPALADVKCVGFILCAGSLDENKPYCSRTCCSQSIKNAIRLKEQDPDRPVYVWFKEVRTFGLLEEYYTKARELGVIFMRYDNDAKPEVSANGSGQRQGAATRTCGRDVELPLDLLVLATPAVPRGQQRAEQAAQGAAHRRRLLPRGARQAAPGRLRQRGHLPLRHRALPQEHRGGDQRRPTPPPVAPPSILAKSVLKAGGVVAEVDTEKCAACLTCVRICPYEVPIIDLETKKAKIEAAACQGCGVCVSECPVKAITLHHYTDAQVFAKEEALFMEVS